MHIGMTYDLRDDYLRLGFSEEETAEFDKPETIEAIERELLALGHRVTRIGNVTALVPRLAQGERWDLVFNIAEGLYGLAREAQIPALLEAYRIPCVFSDALVLALTLDKAKTKSVVASFGVPTPAFALVADLGQVAPDGTLRNAAGDPVPLRYPLFAKPVGEGTGKGVSDRSVVRSAHDLQPLCRDLLARFRQPVLVEEFLPGREFTVGLVGTGDRSRCVGVMEVVYVNVPGPAVYSYENKENWVGRIQYRLVDDPEARRAAEVALRAWRVLGGRDGGRADIRSDAAGAPGFIEVNPLAGLRPGHSDLPIICDLAGIPYSDLIRWIVESASERVASGVAR